MIRIGLCFLISFLSVSIFLWKPDLVAAPQSHITYHLLSKDFYEDVAKSPTYGPIIRVYTTSGSCSGVVIDANYAFTAAHCVSINETLYIKDISRSQESYKTVRHAVVDFKRDVALLRGDFSAFQGTLVDFSGAFAHLKSEVELTSCGYPYDAQFLCTKSKMIGNSFFRIEAKGAFMQPGQSGGPVFDESKKLIGINSAVTYDRLLFGPLVGFDREYYLGVRK